MPRRKIIDGGNGSACCIPVRISKAQHRHYTTLAKKSGITVSEWIRAMLDHFGCEIEIETKIQVITKPKRA